MSKNQTKSNGYDEMGLLRDEEVKKIVNFGVIEDLCGRVRCTCRAGYACRAAGKHPRPDFHPLFLVEEKLTTSGRLNFAIEIPFGLVVIDVDDVMRWKWWLSELDIQQRVELEQVLSECASVRTGRGVHYYLRVCKGTWLHRREGVKIDAGCEIKTAGDVVTIPPSRHRHGQLYAWNFGEGEDGWGPELREMPRALRLYVYERNKCEFLQHKQKLATANMTPYHFILDCDWLAVQNQLVKTSKPAINPDLAYESWAEIGFVLHSTGRDDAFDVFIQWSKKGRKYKGIQTDKIASGFFEKPFVSAIHYVQLEKYGVKFENIDLSEFVPRKK